MPIPIRRPRYGLVRKFYGGKIRVTHHPGRKQDARPQVTSIYRDNKTNLSGPIIGGSAMKKLSSALQSFGMGGHHHHHRRRQFRGGAIGIL